MHLFIFVTGYVGLGRGALPAAVDQNVVCTDVGLVKIHKLKAGYLPIWESRLEGLVGRTRSNDTRCRPLRSCKL